MGRLTNNRRFDFGANPDHDSGLGIFKQNVTTAE